MLLGKIMERIKANKEKTAIITDDKPFTYEDLLSCYEDYAGVDGQTVYLCSYFKGSCGYRLLSTDSTGRVLYGHGE